MRQAIIRRLTLMAGMTLATLAFASPAWATTFTVDRLDDPNIPTGVGACTAAANDCSLRGAIQAANANGQTDTIGFALPGAAPQTITLGNALTVENDTPANDLTINGPGQNLLTVKQSAVVRVFQIVGKATINGITIRGGRSINNAGGVLNNGGANLTLNDTTVTDNEALGTQIGTGLGGGIYNASGATLTLNRSAVSANKAYLYGGGILNQTGGTVTLNDSTVNGNTVNANTVNANASFKYGGGLYNGGTLTLNRSTVSANEAKYGGGISSDTDLADETTTVTNSTISGNTASTEGGGIYNFEGLTRIENSTITDNTAPSGEGSGVASAGETDTRTEVFSTIIAHNANNDDVRLTGGAINSFLSNGYNRIGGGDATAAFDNTGDLANIANPGLNPLAGNGGPTQTHALLGTSPALDKGTNAGCPATDQRGVKRRQGPRCDIGAFELEQPNIPPVARNDSYGGVEDRTLNVPARGVLRNDTDAEGDALTARRVSGPGKGRLTLRPNGSFAYTPPRNFNGAVSFVYRAGDGRGGVDNATATIRVRARPG